MAYESTWQDGSHCHLISGSYIYILVFLIYSAHLFAFFFNFLCALSPSIWAEQNSSNSSVMAWPSNIRWPKWCAGAKKSQKKKSPTGIKPGIDHKRRNSHNHRSHKKKQPQPVSYDNKCLCLVVQYN